MLGHVWILLVIGICAGLLMLAWVYRENSRLERYWQKQQEAFDDVQQERDRVMDAYLRTQQELSSFYDLVLVGLFRSSLDGTRFIAANTQAAEIHGYESAEDLVENGAPLDLHRSKSDRDIIVSRLLAQRFIRNYRMEIYRRDGEKRIVLANLRIHPDGASIEGSVLDITEYEEARSELIRKSHFIQGLLNALPTPVFYKSTDGKYRLVNNAFLHMVGKSVNEILNKSVFDVSPPKLAAKYHAMDEALFKASGWASQRYDYQVSSPEGVRDVVFSKETILSEEGRVEGLVGVVTDVSKLKRQEREIREKTALLNALVHSAGDYIFFKNPMGKYVLCNEAFAAVFGMKPDELEGLSDFDIHPKEFAEFIIAKDVEAKEAGKAILYEVQHPELDAGLQLETMKQPVFADDGEFLGLMGISRDITVRKKIENALREAEQRYRTIFENAAEGIFTCSADGQLLNVNTAMARIFGYESSKDMVNMVVHTSELYGCPNQRTELLEELKKTKVVRMENVEGRRRDGSTFWVALSLQAVEDERGELKYIDGIVWDVSTRVQEKKELVRQASTDALTGFLNRKSLFECLESELAVAKAKQQELAVLFMDLDGFKDINDNYGHHAGDELLRDVAKRLQDTVRRSDIIGRVGGDEFVIVLPNSAGVRPVERVASNILAAMNQDFTCGGESCKVGVSIGISLYPHHSNSAKMLVHFADEAMYNVKKSGKNGLLFADM